MWTYGRDIAEGVLFARQDLPQEPPHDLARPRFGKIVDHKHRLGGRERPDGFSHLKDQVLADLVVFLVAVLQSDKGIDRLAGEVVADTHDGRFGNLV